jgi:hypothetical protein
MKNAQTAEAAAYTAGGVIGDLIYFLNYFLTGKLTMRFMLKSVTVLVIRAAIFVIFTSTLR